MAAWQPRPSRAHQPPGCLFIGCTDGPAHLPAAGAWALPGVTRLRTVGNVVPRHGAAPQPLAAAIAHAMDHGGVTDLIVCGHTDCPALRTLLLPEALAPDETTRRWVAYAAATRALVREHYLHLDGEALFQAAVQEHVLLQLDQLLTHPPVKRAADAGAVRLHAWVHEAATGDLHAYDPHTGQFEHIDAPPPSRPARRHFPA